MGKFQTFFYSGREQDRSQLDMSFTGKFSETSCLAGNELVPNLKIGPRISKKDLFPDFLKIGVFGGFKYVDLK